jgi:mycothiol synthase
MIRELDAVTATDGVLLEVYRLIRGVGLESAPDVPSDPPDEILEQLRHPRGGAQVWHWVCGSPVHGHVQLTLPRDSTTAYLRLLVAPERRRAGLGSALLATAARQARAVGCARLTAITGLTAGEAFANAAGAVFGRTSVRSVLHLPRDPGGPSAELAAGYSVRSWVRTAPDELLDSYAVARNAINDAPWDEGVAKENWTPDAVRHAEAAIAGRGRQVRVTVGLAPDGTVAGFTEIQAPVDVGVNAAHAGTVASTEDTAVRREHRGRGVGLAIKAESLRLLIAERPDVRQVTTTNAAENEPMLAINRRLGFVPVSRVRTVNLDL